MSILDNAVKSIQLGMEDFHDSNPDRVLSSIRNLYAGILLLFKHRLLMLAPEGEADALIKSRVLPTLINGKIEWKGKGKRTIDFQEIKERFDSLGLSERINWRNLEKVQNIRNDIEHLYSTSKNEVMKEAIANSLEAIIELSQNHFGILPADLLGQDCWSQMLQIKTVYDEELKRAQTSLESLDWGNIPFKKLIPLFKCIECGSSLVGVESGQDGEKVSDASYSCRACGEGNYSKELLRRVVVEWGDAVAYERVTGGAGPFRDTCRGCGEETYLVDYETCLICDYELEYSDCWRCGESLSIEDQYLEGLCNLCDSAWQKIQDE